MDSKVTAGVAQTVRAIGKSKDKDARLIATVLDQVGGVILRKSNGYCPIRTGKLVKSGKKEVIGVGFGAVVTVTYGGGDVDYAIYVHENLEAFHKPPTCAKFLERSARETRGTAASLAKRTLVNGTVQRVDYANPDLK